MKIQSFVFVHDQEIILEYLKVNKFSELPNLKYVFLGKNPTDKVEILENVIIARNLPQNIEEYPLFTSFTGWYCLWKNNLIDCDIINLFEYDIVINNNFTEILKNLLIDYDFIGYLPYTMSMNYIQEVRWIENIVPSIEKNYNVNIIDIVNEQLKKDGNSVWSSTSNSTFTISTFMEYMNWFEKLIDDLKSSTFCGHSHERSISFFHLINNKKIYYLSGFIRHYQLDSHGTQSINADMKFFIKELTKK